MCVKLKCLLIMASTMWCVWGVHCLLFFEVLGYGEGWIVAISLCVLGDFIPWKWNNCLLVYGALIANTL